VLVKNVRDLLERFKSYKDDVDALQFSDELRNLIVDYHALSKKANELQTSHAYVLQNMDRLRDQTMKSFTANNNTAQAPDIQRESKSLNMANIVSIFPNIGITTAITAAIAAPILALPGSLLGLLGQPCRVLTRMCQHQHYRMLRLAR